MQNEYKGIVPEESRYMQWNEEVRENRVRIWHWNCSGGGGKFGLRCKLVCGWTNFEGGWHRIGDKSLSRVNNGDSNGRVEVERCGADAIEYGCDCSGYRYVRFAEQRGGAAGRLRAAGCGA